MTNARTRREKTETAIRRILLTFDAAAHSPAVLEAVAALAARLESEILGVFVEDVDLLRAAELPFARHVSLATAMAESFEPGAMETELRRLAARAEREMAEAAARMRVRHSFRVVRGRAAAEVTALAGEFDLLVLEGGGRPLTRHVRLSAPTRAAAGRVRGSVLILHPEAPPAGRPVAVYDASAGADKAVDLAARLAGEGGELAVLVAAASAAEARSLERRARQALRPRRVEVRWRPLPAADVVTLCAAVREMGGGLVVMSAASPLLEAETAGRLIEESLRCPLLLVR